MYEQNGVNNEKLIIEGRKHLSLSGVESVDSFNEQCLKLTVVGNKMQILGENIKISAFNKSNGNLCAEGEFYEIKYYHKKLPVMKRVFK